MAALRFVRAGQRLIAVGAIRSADFSDVESLRVTIVHAEGTDVADGIHAIEALMELKPSALEGRRLTWAKRAWMLHNFVGHPLMQVFALFRMYRASLWIHDATVPRPLTPSARRAS